MSFKTDCIEVDIKYRIRTLSDLGSRVDALETLLEDLMNQLKYEMVFYPEKPSKPRGSGAYTVGSKK